MKITTALCLSLTALTLLLTSAVTTAAIYKTVDKHGNTVYTDNPPANQPAETVELPSLNTQPPVSVQQRSRTTQSHAATRYQVSINAPAPGAQIPMGQHEIPVSVELSPALQDGDYLQVLLNGTPFGGVFYSPQIVLTEVYRGEHSLQVGVFSQDGEELARSESVTLYVQRPSVLRRARP